MSISRRDFLRLSALGLGSALLGSCSGKNAPDLPGTVDALSATFQPKAGPAPSLAEILGRPTDRGLTLSTVPAADGELLIEYGTSSGAYAARTAALQVKASAPVHVLLEGLQRNTRYYFRSAFSATGAARFAAGPEHTFVTQRDPGSSFTFTIDADPHNADPNFNAELYGVTLGNVQRDQPDFHINLGDTFMTEKLRPRSMEDVTRAVLDMRLRLALLGTGTPLFLVNGNHDGEQGWLLDGSEQNVAVWCTKARREYFPTPEPGGFYSGSTVEEPFIGIRDAYYAWTWGDALFVALDPFWYTRSKPRTDAGSSWGYTLGESQYQWLKETLQSSNASYKFIFLHNLVGGLDKDARGGVEAAGLYEWGGRNQDGSWGFAARRSGWGLPIHALLVQNHVSAVFHGHDHVFVRQELDGIVYQECPQSSITRYNNTQLAEQYGYVHGDVRSSSGHLRVMVAPGQATVEYVRAYRPEDEMAGQTNGQVDFSYSITGA